MFSRSFILIVLWLFVIRMTIYFYEKKNKIKSNFWSSFDLWTQNNEVRITDTVYEEEPAWRKFEKEIAWIFEMNWWEVKLWPGSADNGKDIVIRKESETYLVQVKHRYGNKFVSPKEIRDFQWAIDLYNKTYWTNAKWIFLTSWKTTFNARSTASSLWILLRDKRNRKKKIYAFD